MSALTGVRVVELSHERTAWAGKLLADMGADVVLVEPPGGDPTRAWPPFAEDVADPERSLYWWHHQTSKRGVALDLEDARGRDVLRRLVAGADVLLEGEAPGRLASLGLEYAALAALRPELVMASITPFGQAGRDEPATDLTLLAAGGPVWSCGYDDHALPPVRGLGGQSLHIGGHYAVLAVLTALLHRMASGEGQHVDVSLYHAANVTSEMASYHWLVQRTTVQRQTGRHAMEIQTLPTQIRCADGRHVCTGVPPRRRHEFARLVAWLESLGIDELAFPELVFLRRGAERDVDFGQIGVDDEATAIFSAAREALNLAASRLSAREFFLGAQREAGIPVGVIYAPEEAYEDEHFRARGFQVEVPHPELGRTVRYPGAPWRFEKTPWRIARRAPRFGEHSDEVLAEAGLAPAEIAELRAAGVVPAALRAA